MVDAKTETNSRPLVSSTKEERKKGYKGNKNADQDQKTKENSGHPDSSRKSTESGRRRQSESRKRDKSMDNSGNQVEINDAKNEQLVPKSSKSTDYSTSPIKVQSSNYRVCPTPHYMVVDDTKDRKKLAMKLHKQQVPQRHEYKVKMPLFSHLMQMEKSVNLGSVVGLSASSIHPCFITFGLQCADGFLFCPRQRAIRLIECLKIFIKDYDTSDKSEFCRDFESKLSPSLSFLAQCRPFSSGMSTIIKMLKNQLYESLSLSDEETKSKLFNYLDRFMYERVTLAGDIISSIVNQKIVGGDVILTYGMSSFIIKGLVAAQKDRKCFRVIVADSSPRYEGRKAIRTLIENEISCTYIGINGLSYVMKDVTKIIIGVNSLLSNGAVMGPIGSALLAIVGKSRNVPVLVCCETYNFSERAQTDAIVYNELGDPADILDLEYKIRQFNETQKKNFKATVLNLYHDVIQADCIAAVITEIGIIPCTSAPVVLRVKN